MKVIEFSLDTKSIGAAIVELDRYRNDIADKCGILRKMVAEHIYWDASEGFSSAIATDAFRGDPPPKDVSVVVNHYGNVSVIIASGKDAVFIEYGAGVYHNGGEGMIGSSPHPWVEDGTEKRPFFIGMYGNGNGTRSAWGFYKNGAKGQDNVVVTHGTPSAKPMYNGYKRAVAEIGEMVREVFG